MKLAEYPDPEGLFAWAKYLYWAELLYRRTQDVREESSIEDSQARWLFFAHMSQWFAAQFVVVEGWRALEARDIVIDRLLTEHLDKVDRLRKFRNTVYHFQPSLLDKRILEFHDDQVRTIPWLHHLHAEFLRYYWDAVVNFPGNTEQRAEMRGAALSMVGWIPEDVFPAKLLAAEEEAAETARLTAGDNSPAAEAYRQASANLVQVARRAVKRYGASLEALYRDDPPQS